MGRLSRLMESNLQKAELVLAAKGLAANVQKQLENVAKMRVDDLLPLVDRMKEVFGTDAAEEYKNQVDKKLETLQEMLEVTKDAMENAANVLNGDEEAVSDMEPELGPDMDDDDVYNTEDDFGGSDTDDVDVGDDDGDGLDATDAMDGGDEPLGRKRRK